MQDDDLGSNMTGSSVAKQNTALIKKINQLLSGANIILFSINHILDDIQLGFLPKPVQVGGLKQGERLPGGKTNIYLANNMFRFDEKSQLKDGEGYHINGTVVDITIVKSRTNINKRSVPLIFNKTEGGFDNILSIFHYLKTEGYVGGAGKALYFTDYPEIKFSQKDFKELLNKDVELQKAFGEVASKALNNLLSDTKSQEISETAFDINNYLISQI